MSSRTPLTHKALRQSAVPPFQDVSSDKPSMSRAKNRKIPKEVRHWQDFELFLTGRITQIPPQLQNSGSFERMFQAQQENNIFLAGNESELVCIFDFTIGSALDRLVSFSIKTTTWPQAMLGGSLSVPDFISQDYSPDPSSAKQQPGEGGVIIVGEMKRRNFVSDHEDNNPNLAELYKKRPHVRDGIHQTVGYCVQNKCRYAFISTCTWTWALRLTDDGILDISPPYHCSTRNDSSVVSMMYVIIQEASKWKREIGNQWSPPDLDDVID
jgi:hypothetical protein